MANYYSNDSEDIYIPSSDTYISGPKTAVYIPEGKSRSQLEEENRVKKLADERRANIKDRYYADQAYNAGVDFQRETERIEQEVRYQNMQESMRTAEKQRHITEAKKRYQNLSFFNKLFAKKIDYFKKGPGYYNVDNMTNDQIDNLYTGKGR